MSYNEFFQAEIKAGKSEIKAANIARAKFQLQNTRLIKGRNVMDAHAPKAFNI
jgi:hypothetical protein